MNRTIAEKLRKGYGDENSSHSLTAKKNFYAHQHVVVFGEM